MPKSKIPTGPHGQTVQRNIARLRESQNLSYAEMARRLADTGNPIAPLALRRIEHDERKVDPDDLVTIAYVLGVSPAILLQPETNQPEEDVTGPDGEPMTARELWRWIRDGGDPRADRVNLTTLLQSQPGWAVEEGPEAAQLWQRVMSWQADQTSSEELAEMFDRPKKGPARGQR